jgi:hypothetical protein
MNSSSLRIHSGTGPLAAPRKTSVFINCPFDLEYRPVFDAVVFSALCCGFLPRSALETGTSSTPRMERIVASMRASKYSIHDLSRCRGDGDMNLARFNMPLELGIAMAQRLGADSSTDQHDWLVLVPRGHLYQDFISDLAGYDPRAYDDGPQSVVPAVMGWLATRPDAVQTPTPQNVLGALPEFNAARAKLGAEWCGQVPWADLLTAAIRIARVKGLIPIESAA